MAASCRRRTVSADVPHGLLFLGRHPIRHDGIGVPVAHAVLGLEPGDHFHVFHALARWEQVQPMRDRLTVLFLNGREVRSGAFGFFGGGHGACVLVQFFAPTIVATLCNFSAV